MAESFFLRPPAPPARGRSERFGERGAEFVDRRVVAELGIDLGALAHGFGQRAEKGAVVRAGKIEIGGMIVGELAGGKVLRMMAAAGVRAGGVHAAPAVAQQRAGDVLRGVLEGRERAHLLRMRGEADGERGPLGGGKVSADVVGDEKDFVRENIDPQRAAEPAAGAARELYAGGGHGLRAELVHAPERGAQGVVKIGGRLRVGKVSGELLRGVGHGAFLAAA